MNDFQKGERVEWGYGYSRVTGLKPSLGVVVNVTPKRVMVKLDKYPAVKILLREHIRRVQ